MHVLVIYPLVIRVGISLPFDQILKGASSAVVPRVQNLLDFVFFLIIDQVWRWSRVICSMEFHLMIGCEKIDMKHVMNTPLCGKLQPIIDG